MFQPYVTPVLVVLALALGAFGEGSEEVYERGYEEGFDDGWADT